MKRLETEIEINAAPAQVWQILMDFANYPQWNPFIKSIVGEPRAGNKIEAFLQPPGGGGMKFKPEVLINNPPHEFRWRGKFLISGLFDGEHYFQINQIEEKRVRFVQGEIFTGIWVGLVWHFIGENTEKGFRAMNAALKQKAETV